MCKIVFQCLYIYIHVYIYICLFNLFKNKKISNIKWGGKRGRSRFDILSVWKHYFLDCEIHKNFVILWRELPLRRDSVSQKKFALTRKFFFIGRFPYPLPRSRSHGSNPLQWILTKSPLELFELCSFDWTQKVWSKILNKLCTNITLFLSFFPPWRGSFFG